MAAAAHHLPTTAAQVVALPRNPNTLVAAVVPAMALEDMEVPHPRRAMAAAAAAVTVDSPLLADTVLSQVVAVFPFDWQRLMIRRCRVCTSLATCKLMRTYGQVSKAANLEYQLRRIAR